MNLLIAVCVSSLALALDSLPLLAKKDDTPKVHEEHRGRAGPQNVEYAVERTEDGAGWQRHEYQGYALKGSKEAVKDAIENISNPEVKEKLRKEHEQPGVEYLSADLDSDDFYL